MCFRRPSRDSLLADDGETLRSSLFLAAGRIRATFLVTPLTILVSKVGQNGVTIESHTGSGRLDSRTVIWAGGVTVAALGRTLAERTNAETDNGWNAQGFVRIDSVVPQRWFVALIENGNAYVNVHTNDGVAPVNTGPGDFPGGEIRGQVETRGQR